MCLINLTFNLKLIYALSSLVAEFGGTLGLFLGFSFIGLSDQLHHIGKLVTFLRERMDNDKM